LLIFVCEIIQLDSVEYLNYILIKFLHMKGDSTHWDHYHPLSSSETSQMINHNPNEQGVGGVYVPLEPLRLLCLPLR